MKVEEQVASPWKRDGICPKTGGQQIRCNDILIGSAPAAQVDRIVEEHNRLVEVYRELTSNTLK